MTEKHLYLVDGHALAYRAYYAMIRNPLINSKGLNVSAVYGMVNYIISLITKFNCPYFAVVFDSPKPTFRKKIYEDYKANRKSMPEEMIAQIPLIFDFIKRMNIPYILQDGLEADDILATLTKKAESEGFKVSIVTKDKDLMQLITDNVRMISPENGGKMSIIKAPEVLNKMGVPPNKVLDLLTLMGDSADNIPGIPGVGPKTAIKIINTVGSVDALLKNPKCVGNTKLANKIKDNIDNILLSKKLATLIYDANLNISIEDLKRVNPNTVQCAEFFKEMEFTSFLNNPMFNTNVQTEFTAKTVLTIEELSNIVKKIQKENIVSIDTETTSVNPRDAELVGISLATDDTTAWYVPLAHANTDKNLPIKEVLSTLHPILESKNIKKIGQNLKYDYQVFKNYGKLLNGIYFDTMIAAYLLDPGKRQFGMDELASRWLSIDTISITELIGKGKNQKSFTTVPIDLATKYSGEDAVIPLKLMNVLKPLLKDKNLYGLFTKIEIPLVSVLADMEWDGILIDCNLLENLSKTHTKTLLEISKNIYDLAGEEFNLNSPKQISEIFFTKLNMPKSKKTKTGLSTNVDALEKLAIDFPIAKKMLEYRTLQKLLSTYIDALPNQINKNTHRLHTSLNQTITATGRLSSTNPNLQNIPIKKELGKQIREAFIAPEGYSIVSADYSQIELRILAHMSNDSLLIQSFKDDMDIHTQTAAAINGVFPEMVTEEMRRTAKTINFGLMYGMGPIKLAKELNISFKEAREFISLYFEQFPTIQNFMDKCVKKARENGYSETLLERRRYLPEINSSNRQIRESAERTAVNTPVQGTASDIIKIAMINIQKNIFDKFKNAKMLLQVHDELIFEIPTEIQNEFIPWIRSIMSSACELSVPLKVDIGIGKNWREAH